MAADQLEARGDSSFLTYRRHTDKMMTVEDTVVTFTVDMSGFSSHNFDLTVIDESKIVEIVKRMCGEY